MAKIIKAYREHFDAMRFIGKKYTNNDRVNGTFAAKWGEWFQNGWFDLIESAPGSEDGCVGLMNCGSGDDFAYWIGRFAPESAPVPDGFDFLDFSECELGVCWILGKEPEIYCKEDACAARLEQEGCALDFGWCFERYVSPRFTTPDEDGNIILDVCFFLK